jgi:DNA invertase Pin-like site-specific DNA recombinase
LADRWDRRELSRLLDQLRKGDMLVVWKLDRLLYSLKDVLTLMATVEKVGAGFLSLTEAVDTISPAGRMMMQIVGAFAEFERAMLREPPQTHTNATKGNRPPGRFRSKNSGWFGTPVQCSSSSVARLLARSRRTK